MLKLKTQLLLDDLLQFCHMIETDSMKKYQICIYSWLLCIDLKSFYCVSLFIVVTLCLWHVGYIMGVYSILTIYMFIYNCQPKKLLNLLQPGHQVKLIMVVACLQLPANYEQTTPIFSLLIPSLGQAFSCGGFDLFWRL